MKAGQFYFDLYDAAGQKIDTATNDESGAFSFARLEFGQEDIGKTFEYTVREQHADEVIDGIRYADDEIPVSVTVSAGDGGNIIAAASGSADFTNTQLASLTVNKTWNDNDNADGLRPKSITIGLIKDGKNYLSAELSEENGWMHTFTEVPKNSKYSIYEENNGKYSVSYSGNAQEGYVVTNTYPADNTQNVPPEPTSPGTTDIPVEKIWLDNNNERGIRPQSITVRLIKDGGIYRELELTEETGWRGVFSEVPSDASYSITEKEVQDYWATYTKSADNGFIITNAVVPGNAFIGVPPKPFVPALTDESVSASVRNLKRYRISFFSSGESCRNAHITCCIVDLNLGFHRL